LFHRLEVGADRSAQAAGDLAEALSAAGCEVVSVGAIGTAEDAVAAGRRLAEAHVDAVALAPGSWFEDFLVLDLLEESLVPVLLWPLPGMETGALCGAQQVTSYLHQLEASYASVFGRIEPGENLERAMMFLRAAALRGRLRRARIGQAGHRVTGMTEAAANEIGLKKVLGPRVVPLNLSALLARAEAVSEEESAVAWQAMTDRCASVQVSNDAGLDSMRIYLALAEVVKEQGLDALTVGCYPDLMGRVCLAASLLADAGVPLACEGDVNGAVGQLVLSLLSGLPTHSTDWLEPLADGSVIFSHCGSGSFSLAEHPDEVKLASVRLMGQGACALFTARPGPVTLINLTSAGDGYRCALLEGEALPVDMVFPGNPLRVQFAQRTCDLLDWVHEAGLSHHWMAGYGHWGGTIRAWAKLAGRGLALVEPSAS